MHALGFQILVDLFQGVNEGKGARLVLHLTRSHRHYRGIEFDEHELVLLHHLIEIVVIQEKNTVLLRNLSERKAQDEQCNEESVH